MPSTSRIPLTGLKDLYIPDINYKNAGVMLTDLANQDVQQEDLFDGTDSDASKRLMQTIDAINKRQGRGTVFMAAVGINQTRWKMRTDLKSPSYLSKWNQIGIAKS